MTEPELPVRGASAAPDWAATFDAVSDVYDQSGVPFFHTIAEGLASRLAARPGERVLELGPGRGALTVQLATAVGPEGHVDAVDVSQRMTEYLTQLLREEGLDQVSVRVGDASDPGLPTTPYDVVAGSLMLFFLTDPVAGLSRWREAMRAGARVGVATFAPWTPSWAAVEGVFASHAPAPDGPPPTQMPEAFQTDDGVAGLFGSAGFTGVRTERATYRIPFQSLDQWRAFSMGTAMRGLWALVPQSEHDAVVREVGQVLAANGNALEVDIRYTLAAAPSFG